MFKRNASLLLSLSILLGLPRVAFANAGIPMIYLAMPVFGLSIIPIILIEVLYLRHSLTLRTLNAFKITTLSNLVSTFIGIPLTWLLLVVIELLGGDGGFGLETTLGKVLSVTLQAPWLVPYESDLHWMIPVAGLVLLVPFFFASYWSEYFMTQKMLRTGDKGRIKKAVRNANIITYLLLTLWPIGFWMANSVIVAH